MTVLAGYTAHTVSQLSTQITNHLMNNQIVNMTQFSKSSPVNNCKFFMTFYNHFVQVVLFKEN